MDVGGAAAQAGSEERAGQTLTGAQVRTLLFIDLVDSTALTQRLGDDAAAQLWAQHDRIARDLAAGFRAREIDRTDGFFLLFDYTADAAAFALAYHPLAAGLGVGARVGMHRAAVLLRENEAADIGRGAKPLEVEGLAKSLTARVMALARGGQTLLTASARAALGADTATPRWQVHSHGHYRFKGLADPIEIHELGPPDRPPGAPPPDGDKGYRVVRQLGLWQPLRQVPHNLPPERDLFVGRQAELAAIAGLFDAGARLVTLLGPGGSGKTRLARRFARMWLGDWPGGAFFCDLSEARSLEGVLFAVAQALDVALPREGAVERIGHALAGRGRCLVILDNFEQVAALAQQTLGHWLDRAAEAGFLATTRERLQLNGERALPLEPLALADEAIELFVARALSRRADFVLDEDGRAAVAEAVRLLDGLPLAIELAAARINVLAPRQIVQRLRDRFALLAGARGNAARQATLRAAIDWSWELLGPWEQAALAQCSVFEGGFTLEAAEQVLDLSAWPDAGAAIDVVQSLVDKSLLRTWRPAAAPSRLAIDEPYFGMYISIHEYARARQAEAGPEAERAVMRRHAVHYAALGSAAGLRGLNSRAGPHRWHALALEVDNLAAACRRALERGWPEEAAAAFVALWEVLGKRGPFAPAVELGRSVAQAAAAIPAAARLRALRAWTSALGCVGRSAEAAQTLQAAFSAGVVDPVEEGRTRFALGSALMMLGRLDEASAQFEQSRALHHTHAQLAGEARATGSLGQIHNEQGRTALALEHYERALELLRAADDRLTQCSVLNLRGVTLCEGGRLDEGGASYEEALAIAREFGDRTFEGTLLTNLGCLRIDQNRLDEAAAFLEQALALHREIGNRRFEGYALGDLGRLAMQRQAWDEAERCLELSLAITRETGDRRIEGSELRSLADLHLARGRLDRARALQDQAERLLRELGDKLYLGYVLCSRAELALREARADEAAAARGEAQALAADIGAGPDSELRRRIAAVQALGA
jgi:predicted ATPase/class 3 adenylate cyclase